MLAKNMENLDYEEKNILKSIENGEEFRKSFLNNTLNFTADALKKSLQEIIYQVTDSKTSNYN